MIAGYRLLGRKGSDRATFLRTIWEYTPGTLVRTGSWLTNTCSNADAMTIKGNMFDRDFNAKGKIVTLAIPASEMGLVPIKENDYYESYKLFWYTAQSQGNDDFWREIIFHHAKVALVKERNFPTNNASYFEVSLKIMADVEYLDSSGIPTN